MNHLFRVIIYDINLGFNSNLTDGKQLVKIKTNTGIRKDDLLQGCCGLAGEMHTAVTPWTPGLAGRDRFHCIGSGHWVQQHREAADRLTANEASRGDDGFLMLILNWKKRHQLGVVSDRSSPGYLGLTDPGLKPGILDGARVLCEMDWSRPVCVSSTYPLFDFADQLRSPCLDTVGAEAEDLQRQLRSLNAQGYQVQPLSPFPSSPFLLLTEPHHSLFCIYHVQMRACDGVHVGVRGHLGYWSFFYLV